ncbi:MAG TPA: ATP-binding protein [Caulobacteraceae bacterium]|nr:ATP-binding protein [Caulobacteraceae bacterium]
MAASASPGASVHAESKAPESAAADSGLRLFARSAQNLVPRFVSYLCLASVACFFVGPLWSGLWFVAVWAAVFAGLALMNRIQAEPGSRRAPALSNALMASNFVSGALSSALPVALWSTGDELAQTFGLVSLFISAFYVLLHYYANVRTFLILFTPYALALAFIGAELAQARGAFHPAVAVTLIAAAVTLVNFFRLSRTMLDGSRSALRKARAQAREGEAAAEAANHAKSAFLATMSHEIRTPLNGVLGMAQAMAAGSLSEVQRERLAIVHQSGEALLAILNDILDLSKIEAGKLELEEIDFDLGQVVHGAHSAFTAIANNKGLSFALDVGKARGAYLGDPTRLRQILYNLISNAVKFTEKGEIRVTAVYADAMLRLAVSDTGVGIPPEGLKSLFEKFTQVDATTTRRFGGTGLGLAICQQLSRLMGGAIEVESEVGRGSTFSLVIPLTRLGDERDAPALPAPDAQGSERQLALRVLAAEDNTVNQLVLKTLLHRIGIDPLVVGDGAAALEAWEAGEWDAILMDAQMPVMDGLTATKAIRQREAASGRRRTPIIALTANALSHQVAEYLASGMDDHVAKPIEARRLFEALEAAIDGAEEPGLAAVGD